MTRWFRFYDETLNDPKVLRLSDKLYRAWTMLLCFASKNDGVLPSVDDIAASLRTKPSIVSEWIEKLAATGLIDRVGDHFEPHNWNGRQYKSDKPDVTAAERMRNYRERLRMSSVTVTPVTLRNAVTVTVPRTDTDTDTEQKDCAAAPFDPSVPEREFFKRGREVLGKGAGGLLGKLLKAKGLNVALARSALEAASQKENPTEYVAAACRGPSAAKPLTEFQRKQAETNDVRSQLKNLANGGGSSGEADRFLSDDNRQRSQGLRSGLGSNILALPGASGSGGT